MFRKKFLNLIFSWLEVSIESRAEVFIVESIESRIVSIESRTEVFIVEAIERTTDVLLSKQRMFFLEATDVFFGSNGCLFE